MLARLRWRRRGAWMWPTFMALTVADGAIGASWPPAGDGWDPIGAGLFGAFLNLLAIVVVAAPFTLAIRRVRPTMPKVVAHDLVATRLMGVFTIGLLVAGLAHHSRVDGDQAALNDAIKRAQAFIGAHAPTAVQRNLRYVNAFTIEARSSYRVCVPGAPGRQYCVIVNERLPFPRSVVPAGTESNQLLTQGTD